MHSTATSELRTAWEVSITMGNKMSQAGDEVECVQFKCPFSAAQKKLLELTYIKKKELMLKELSQVLDSIQAHLSIEKHNGVLSWYQLPFNSHNYVTDRQKSVSTARVGSAAYRTTKSIGMASIPAQTIAYAQKNHFD